MNKQELFTELSIKIATLDMKLNKVLELLNNQQQWAVVNPTILGEIREFEIPEDWEIGKSDEERFSEEFK